MRRSRGLWISVIFVLALVVGSIVSYAAGIRPILGLDLEGGIDVVLQAPSGTPKPVMDQALENIRNRVDAFGAGEPQLFVSGNTIDVQLPGLANGHIVQQKTDQYCLIGTAQANYGCFPAKADAAKELSGTTVKPVVQQVCLTGSIWKGSPPCFGSQKDAQIAIKAITVAPATSASPSPSPAGPEAPTSYCLNGTGLPSSPCDFATKADAQAALDQIHTQAQRTNCLQDSSKATLTSTTNGAACYPNSDAADSALSAISVTHETSRFCVVSSAGKGLGCFFTHELATAQLQRTGQERLLQVIGQTARLEQRQVIGTIAPSDPSYSATPVTCGTKAEQGTSECSFSALRNKDVVFLYQDGQTKYRLGPVLITGDAIKKATAVYNTGSQTSVGSGWEIDFTTTSQGAATFKDVTTRLLNQKLAIVVDNVVISAPTVNGVISSNGVITGSFTKARAEDLATQLNAGALPVNLTTQQVLTVSPTLGKASLHQGLIAGLAGLIALALYLLFYYRLLGIVAWFGMSIWAILAFALISLAGRAIGYTLTLAGIAGLVISLGVTADSYIVFFERLKDEVRHGKSPRAAVQPAFKRAYKTIVAADVVTALAAVILYLTAISSVRGFALTLGVATALDLFVVYFFKRPVVFLIARNERLVNLHGFGLTSGVAAEPEPGELVPVAGGSR
ncbi:MAG TPA: protein translocase subunit SecD [Actinomycetota bacterium]|nr:protein translocase subunit SecD [Actinomycetota bacterium]